MGANTFARTFTTATNTPKTVTGILVSYNGTVGTVNVMGSTLTLPMLDSVSSSIAVGSTVLCHVAGQSGFIIGSVNTVSRSGSGTWTGGFSNPPVPRPLASAINYSNFTPTQVGAYNDTLGTFSATGTTFTQSNAAGGAWFYGASAFSSLSGKKLLSIEVYLPGLSTGSYPLYVDYHTYATRPSTGGFAGSSVSKSASGWVALPSSYLTALSGSLTAFGVGLPSVVSFSASLTISNVSPNGTLRIGWSN